MVYSPNAVSTVKLNDKTLYAIQEKISNKSVVFLACVPIHICRQNKKQQAIQRSFHRLNGKQACVCVVKKRVNRKPTRIRLSMTASGKQTAYSSECVTKRKGRHHGIAEYIKIKMVCRNSKDRATNTADQTTVVNQTYVFKRRIIPCADFKEKPFQSVAENKVGQRCTEQRK